MFLRRCGSKASFGMRLNTAWGAGWTNWLIAAGEMLVVFLKNRCNGRLILPLLGNHIIKT